MTAKKKTPAPRWNVTKDQGPFRDFGGEDRTIVYRGLCAGCGTRCYGYAGEPCPDPRGMIPPEHTAHDLVASDYDMAGPDVVACYACRDERPRYERILSIARQSWTKRADPTPGAYTAAGLEGRPTLCAGQSDDLKIDDGTTRIWLARTGLEDGERFRRRISVEQIKGGRWETVADYEGA